MGESARDAEVLQGYEGPAMPAPPAALPVARDCYIFILEMGIASAFAVWSGVWWTMALAFSCLGFCLWFFRDPSRDVPKDENAIVSPADGKVIKVEKVNEKRVLKKEALKISIFMNIFDVHVNRIPASGKVKKIVYNRGKFFNASLDKASLDNEQNAVVLETPSGKTIMFNQIAGLIARRIVCHAQEGMTLMKGDRFGLIKFGSRLDVYLPTDVRAGVKIGDRVKAGTSILGYWR